MNQVNNCNCGCDCGTESKIAGNNKKLLIISWQRLISEGNTCPRCGSTEEELEKAVLKLKEGLKFFDIEVILEKLELTLEEFKKDPIQSNRILLNGRTLEDVIGAKTKQSQCCDVCGDEECRTVEIGGISHETIPVEIIVEAGFKAMDL